MAEDVSEGVTKVDREQHEEWRALTNAARASLHAGGWTLRLSILPSFDDAEVLGLRTLRRHDPRLLKRDTPKETFVEWRRWRSSVDAEKLRTPVERLRHPPTLVPTIEYRSAIIPEEQRLALKTELAQLMIPVAPLCATIGLDGTRFEFLSTDSTPSILLIWRNDSPKEWQPLMAWFESTTQSWKRLLNDVVPSHAAPPNVDPMHQLDPSFDGSM